jgi:type I restriction enzyme M protein
MAGKARKNPSKNGAALGFEAQPCAAADQMRGHMDASEYKHVCLGLIFLKYISDAFEEKREQLLFGFSDPKSDWFIKDEPQRAEAAENRDEYLAANVFWLPPEARWHKIKSKAKSPEIGKIIDDAMGAIERENPSLKGVLPRDYARPSLDKVQLGGLVDIISNIGFNEPTAKSKDVLGRVYEYFLGKFASGPQARRKNDEGGERPKGTHETICITHHPLVWKPAENNRSADSWQTAFAVRNIGGCELSRSASRTKQSRVHRQMRRFSTGVGGICLLVGTSGRGRHRNEHKVATALPRVRRTYGYLRDDHQTGEGNRLIGVLLSSFCLHHSPFLSNADSFGADLHSDLKADFNLANPPFNMSDWGGDNLRQDVRWKLGMPAGQQNELSLHN